MTDDFYKKQLEAFGIESVRVTESDIDRKRREDEASAMLAVVKALMERIEGRQWIYSLMDICHTFTPSFTPGKPDVSAFFSGTQAVGQKLFNDVMRACPENFYIMIQEADARKNSAKNQVN